MAAERFTSRAIPADVWDCYKDEVQRLYIGQQKSLDDIKVYMLRKYLFEATTKQWKQQLSKWELKRNLSKTDAAHILRLLIESQTTGIPRRVFFHGKEKTRRDISVYIRKSTIVQTEEDILPEIKPTEPLPWYITYEDISDSRPPSSSPSPLGYTSGERTSSRDPVSMSRSLLAPPDRSSPYLSSTSSPTWSLVDVCEWRDTPSAPRCESPISSIDQSLWHLDFQDPDLSHDGECQPRRTLNLSQRASTASPDPYAGILQPLFKPDPTKSLQCSPKFHAMMSVTPVQGLSGTNVTEKAWDKLPDLMHLTLSGSQGWEQLNVQSHVASFSLNCIRACISRNDGRPEATEEALEHAMLDFQKVLASELEDSLSAVSTIIALFESYGQRVAAREILLGVANTLRDHAGGLPSFRLLFDTVMFFCKTQVPEYGTSGTYDINCLSSILEEFRNLYGDNSKLTLIARYNLAWAELEHKNYSEARAILLELKPRIESVFGRYHLQSISCVATLARAHLRCGEFEAAQILLEETVLGRVEKIFSKTHPYYWEVRHRQATFMMALSDHETDPLRQRTIRSQSEQILREVLLDRLTILGANNPRTSSTFRVLKDLLEQQGRVEEAMNLYNWCVSYSQRMLHALSTQR